MFARRNIRKNKQRENHENASLSDKNNIAGECFSQPASMTNLLTENS
jgi:hypothetical protein